ncbi:MAG TPA: hypothetical protein VIL16_20850 [Trebonia sp.]
MTQATTDEDDDGLLGTVRAAKRLGVSRRKFMELIAAREIATIRIPRRNGTPGDHRIEPAELERFKDRYRQSASA